jgi:hypothetical protein
MNTTEQLIRIKALLNAVEGFEDDDRQYIDDARDAVQKLIEELAAPVQQEPVAWKHDCAALLTNGVELWIDQCPHCGKPRTPPPAQRQWVELTVEQKMRIHNECCDSIGLAIELTTAKLKEKNA